MNSRRAVQHSEQQALATLRELAAKGDERAARILREAGEPVSHRDSIRGLGDRQRGVMNCLLTMGPYPGSGWVYSTRGQTIRILETLVARGLVEKVQPEQSEKDRKYARRNPGLMLPPPRERYQLTTDGRLLAEADSSPAITRREHQL